jgi:hypothetical protein
VPYPVDSHICGCEDVVARQVKLCSDCLPVALGVIALSEEVASCFRQTETQGSVTGANFS